MPSRDQDPADTSFFGHPKGMGYIFATEAGLAFGYYGVVTS